MPFPPARCDQGSSVVTLGSEVVYEASASQAAARVSIRIRALASDSLVETIGFAIVRINGASALDSALSQLTALKRVQA
jgi:hypothetical protein